MSESEPTYIEWFREESKDPTERAAALRHFLAQLDKAGIVEFDVDQGDWYVEVGFETTVTQARIMGYDDDEIAVLLDQGH